MALIDVNGKKFKNFMAKLYGWGASVVILGAMFKILHLPGADIMLVVGLTTEAVIFFFSAFEKPHAEYDWTLVYPELAHMDDPDADYNTASRPGLSPTQELDNMLEDAKIDAELIDSLGSGLRNFGDAASKLNETIDAAAGTQQYGEQVTLAAKNMEALNALYAVQLESSQSQVEFTKGFVEKLAASAEGSEKLSEEVNALATNLSSLNGVYGNMLSAMSVNRG